jgi:hypothetical protein
MRKTICANFDERLSSKLAVPTSLTDEQHDLLQQVAEVYASRTARETCEYFGCSYTNKVAKLLCLVFPKGLGRGGSRKGSGQKKKV